MCLYLLSNFIKRRHFIAAVFLFFSLFPSLPLNGGQQLLEFEELNISQILQRGVLRVGIYYDDKPPFVMTRENGTLYGIDIDLAKDMGQKMGAKVAFDRTSKTYSELIERVSTGVDFDLVISKMSCTMNRALLVRFSKPYLVFHQGLALNKKFLSTNRIKKENPIASLEGMKFKIGARSATSYVEYAKNLFPKAEIIEGPWEELKEKLLSGKIDGLMRDEFTLLSMAKKTPGIALHINIYRITDKKDPIAIAIPEKNSMLQYWLNLYIDNYHPLPMTSADIISNYPEL